jgi:hypothetical protein
MRKHRQHQFEHGGLDGFLILAAVAASGVIFQHVPSVAFAEVQSMFCDSLLSDADLKEALLRLHRRYRLIGILEDNFLQALDDEYIPVMIRSVDMAAGKVADRNFGENLIARNMMNWRIPVAIFAAVIVFSGILHLVDPASYASPGFMLFSGGLMLGAMFMATDMVGSPMTATGCYLYGALIGLVTVVIRIWGGLPEGVMYAILLGNAVTPHLDRWTRPKVYGTGTKEVAS